MSSGLTMGQVVTFYSYKGGTGRSMALANTACLLAQQGGASKPVLAIDWDLEAPGLHLFFRDLFPREVTDPKKAQAPLDTNDGLIDLMIQIDRALDLKQAPLLKHDAASPPAKIEDDILARIDPSKYILRTKIDGLHLLKAGRFDDSYSNRVNTFKWEEFFNKSPDIFRIFASFLARKYAFVLIDSRTGRTDISNICTMLMPEKLVVVFTPNRQSLTGVDGLVKAATTYRRESDDVRPLLVYPLASRIEESEPEDKKRKWRFGKPEEDIVGYQAMFESTLSEAYALPECDLTTYFDRVQIQQRPPYAYGEEIAVLSERGSEISSLHYRYQIFSDWMVAGTPAWESPKEISEEERSLARQLEEERKKSAALQRWLRIVVASGILLIIAGFFVVRSLLYRGYIGDIAKYHKAVIAKPADAQGHAKLGEALENWGRTDEACRQYVQARRLDQNNRSISADLDKQIGRYGITQVLTWNRRAADNGDAEAMNNIGYLYENGYVGNPDSQQAMSWYMKSAELGNPWGLNSVGYFYYSGKGVSQDYKQAAQWYVKAAEAGSADAMTNLGYMYQNGYGLQQDYVAAVAWYRKGAAGGNIDAMGNIGYMYEQGYGVPKDVNQASSWYSKAAEAGNSAAMVALGSLSYYATAVPKDDKLAVSWYRKAADAGNAEGMSAVGFMYDYGYGVPKDPKVAVGWYRKGAEAGSPGGMDNLGVSYQRGDGIDQNYEQAIAWFRKAADAGSASGMFHLGDMLEKGLGGKKDLPQAISWYRKAADQGSSEAADALNRLHVAPRRKE